VNSRPVRPGNLQNCAGARIKKTPAIRDGSVKGVKL
jgi:hypothetical protein